MRAELLGLPIDVVSFEESLKICHTLISKRSSHRADLNASIVLEARKNPELRASLLESDLVNADGQSVVWAARLLGVPLPERVAGIDLFLALIKEAPGRGDRVYLLGARPAVVSSVAARFSSMGVNVVGYRDGYWDAEAEEGVVSGIAATAPDLLFLAMPSPRKEEFVRAHLSQLNAGLAFGVGGSFDVVAGRQKRAPSWMQRAGLEWLFRFLQEPRRLFRRYIFGNIEFAGIIAASKFRSIFSVK